MKSTLFRRILLLITLLVLVITPACGAIKGLSIPFTGRARPTPTAAATSAPTQPPTATPTRTPTALATAQNTAQPTTTLAPSLTSQPTWTPFPSPTSTPQPTKEGYHLVLNENFDGSGLNQDLWNTRYRSGTTNPPELEEYVPEAVNVQNGMLSLTANRSQQSEMPYTSGMIASYDRFYFQYGYVEIRARAPDGQGLWPALWLLAEDPKSANEIDLMEIIGKDTTEVHTTLHYGQHRGNQGRAGSTFRGPDFSSGWHTYAVDWEWNKITWYIDGREVYEVDDHVPREPMFLIANLAVGGVWPGSPDHTTPFPASFDIDYIRVFAPNH